MTTPDLIRQWLIDHPGTHARPATIARDIGVPVHVGANTIRRLLDTGEVVRFRQPSQRGTSGPGVVYAVSPTYAPATNLTEWAAIRARVLANQKGARVP